MPQTISKPLPAPAYHNDDRNTELVPPSDPRFGVISIDPQWHSGTPCFAGTRVPIQDLFDYLEGNENLESFLESFPSVPREQAVRALQLANAGLLEGLSVGSK